MKPSLGDFSDLKEVNTFDYIIAFGSLHHSPCLFSVLQSLTKALKFGGYIIAHEPVMSNYTKQQSYVEKYNQTEQKFDLVFRHGDRYDRFYREAEYVCAGIMNGLDLIACEEFPFDQPKDTKITSKVIYFQNKN